MASLPHERVIAVAREIADRGALAGCLGNLRAALREYDGAVSSPGAGDPEATARIAALIDGLATAYTKEGVGVWLLSKNRSLGGERPVDLIARGELDRVAHEVEALREGTFT